MNKRVIVWATIFGLILVSAIFFVSGQSNKEVNKTRVFIEFNSNGEKKIADYNFIGNEKIKLRLKNKISAELTQEEITKLKKDGRIKRITNVGTRKLFLQDTTILTNATRSWTLQEDGFNLTGVGQSICIIDSGVDYTHPDLGGDFGPGYKVVAGYDFVNSDSDPMDEYGHGTHVAGIAAGSGNRNGIAPGANIVAIRACANISCSDDDIMAGIEWCTSNKNAFNISVISMSLGSIITYPGYCNDDSLNESIWFAIRNNISVVVSSGNQGENAAITAPGCIENVTTIGATYKDDSIAYNRNYLVKLLAPGIGISSTCMGGGYCSKSGTSMATPHVAGALTILNQYLTLTNRQRTPKQLESVLNDTGKNIIDDSTGRSYSRINIYDALILLDSDSPNVSLIYPNNNAVSLNSNWTFRCNTTDLALSNISLYLWNSSGIVNTSNSNSTGAENEKEFNISNLGFGRYYWNCLSTDKNGNSAFAPQNNTFRLGSLDARPYLVDSFSNSAENNFSCSLTSVNESELINVTIRIWNFSEEIYNLTKNVSGQTNITEFNYTFLEEGEYLWNCFGYNNESNTSYGEENATVIYDITKPNVSLSSPQNGYSHAGTTQVTFIFNVSEDKSLSYCNLILNSENVSYNSSTIINGEDNSIVYSLGTGSYNWGINCTDKAGNEDNSSTRTLTISAIQSSGGGSSGGGGGGIDVKLIEISEIDLLIGQSKNIIKGDKIKFSIRMENHTLTLRAVNESYVNISIQSEEMNITLNVGEERWINLTNGEYYDLYLKLEDITNGKVNLTMKEIYQEIPKNNSMEKREEKNNTKDYFIMQNNSDNQAAYFNEVDLGYIIWGIGLFLGLMVFYFLFRYFIFRNKQNEKIEEERKTDKKRISAGKKKRNTNLLKHKD